MKTEAGTGVTHQPRNTKAPHGHRKLGGAGQILPHTHQKEQTSADTLTLASRPVRKHTSVVFGHSDCGHWSLRLRSLVMAAPANNDNGRIADRQSRPELTGVPTSAPHCRRAVRQRGWARLSLFHPAPRSMLERLPLNSSRASLMLGCLAASFTAVGFLLLQGGRIGRGRRRGPVLFYSNNFLLAINFYIILSSSLSPLPSLVPQPQKAKIH